MSTVLVTKFREFTDVIMTLPVIYSACRSHPFHNFVLLTRPALVPLFINPPANLRVEGWNPDNYKGSGNVLKAWNNLKNSFHPSILVALDTEWKWQLLALRARMDGCLSSFTKKPHNKKLLIRKNNKVMLPIISARARYREAFFRVGLPVQEHFKGLYGENGKGNPELFSSITKPPVKGEVWIGIAPFAKHKGKSYPIELMEEVIESLEKELRNLKIFIFGGGEEEREIIAKLADKHPTVNSPAVARLGFPAELSLLSYMNVMVTMDSANMHLASLVGVNVITVWGATHPYGGYKGWHQRESANVSLPMPCRPCSLYGDKPCHRGDYLCLNAIKPSFIVEKITSVLSQEPS